MFWVKPSLGNLSFLSWKHGPFRFLARCFPGITPGVPRISNDGHFTSSCSAMLQEHKVQLFCHFVAPYLLKHISSQGVIFFVAFQGGATLKEEDTYWYFIWTLTLGGGFLRPQEGPRIIGYKNVFYIHYLSILFLKEKCHKMVTCLYLLSFR